MIRLGFLPLIDAAPIIAAKARGYFAEEGLNVTLHRQVGWANIRDKLSFGHIDAAHALLGMPLVSHLGRD
jgi:ABC-type nitrate/sulfonate/bicarbonate transport system substrate-binding protein